MSTDEIVDQAVVATFGKFQLTASGMTVAPSDVPPTFDEWSVAFEWCKKVEKASAFWVGDMLAYGEHQYGEMYAQVLDATDAAYGTLRNAVYVSSKVELSRRRDNLPFAIHQEVAPLPPAEQDVWLKKAEEDGLSQKELRHQIKVARAESTGTPIELMVTVWCTDLGDQEKLAARMKAEGRPVKLHAKV